jgi:hypothetical protein
MPFGICNAPASFQAMTNQIFCNFIDEGWLTVYMDDIIIYTKAGESLELHHMKVHKVLDWLEENNLYLRPSKCAFEQKKTDFLGIIVSHETVSIDIKKLANVADWQPPKDVWGVRRFLGFTGFYRHFIAGYSDIVWPLLELTKKAATWHWGPEQSKAFDELKTHMCTRPILRQPNFSKRFFVQTDTSNHGVGAILLQEGEELADLSKETMPKLHLITFYSTTFTPTQQKYDIYEKELYAIVKSLEHWRPYLVWGKYQFIVLTDHANLTFWKHPWKLNDWTARWHVKLQDYDFVIHHVRGKVNLATDALSRSDDMENCKEREPTTVLKPKMFTNVSLLEPENTTKCIRQSQNHDSDSMKQWREEHHEHLIEDSNGGLTYWCVDSKEAIIPPDLKLRCYLMDLHHNHLTAGCLGRDETITKMRQHYYWPGMAKWIKEYIQGCTTCQESKICTHQAKASLYKIPVSSDAKPFKQVAMDLITGLPQIGKHNAILTIVDHGCLHTTIFLPVSDTITGAGIAQLYMDYVYRWFGLPTKVISDRVPCFTSHFGKELARTLTIGQNLSTAFHPQTDGLSECKNQWIEQYLYAVTGGQPEDWKKWLSIATTVHNNQVNSTIRMTPN